MNYLLRLPEVRKRLMLYFGGRQFVQSTLSSQSRVLWSHANIVHLGLETRLTKTAQKSADDEDKRSITGHKMTLQIISRIREKAFMAGSVNKSNNCHHVMYLLRRRRVTSARRCRVTTKRPEMTKIRRQK